MVGSGGILVLVILAVLLITRFPLTKPARTVPRINLTAADADVRTVVQSARKGVLQSIDSADAWGRLGMVLFAHQFDDDAADCFRSAAELAPEDFRWPYYLGLVMTASNHYEAVSAFQRAAELRPDFSTVHVRIGELFLDTLHFDQAARHLRIAVDIAPTDPRPQLDLARVALQCGEFAAAQKWAESASRLQPDSRTIHEVLALIYRRQRNERAALEHLAIVESLPDQALIWNDSVAAEVLRLRADSNERLSQAASLMDEGQAGQALNLLHNQIEQGARDPAICLALGQGLIKIGRFQEAYEVLDADAKKFPYAADFPFQMGIALFRTEKYVEAIRCFEKALVLKSDFALASYNLGHAYLKIGKEAEAFDRFEAAVRIAPEMSDARVNLGKLMLKLDRKDDALEQLQLALRASPGHADARRFYETLKAEQPPHPTKNDAKNNAVSR